MSFKGPTSLKARLGIGFARVPIIGQVPIARYLRARYGDRVVSPAKVDNFIRMRRDMLRRRVSVDSLPTVLNLDTFNACNLKCPFCPTGTDQMERVKAKLSIDRAKRLIDRVKEHVLEIRFYNWGEPFLNPDIFELIRYAHDAGLYTVVNSNLSIRVDDLAAKVVESKLDRLQGSVDGLTQKTLPIYRVRAEASLVFENVRRIVAERKRRGVDYPRIELAFLVFRHNEHEVPQLEEKRQEIGADKFFPRRAFIFEPEYVPAHKDFQPMQEIFEGTCDYLYSELTVEATGAVSPCCANTSDRWDVGTIEDTTDMRAFWNSRHFRAMRAFNAGVDGEELAGSDAILCKTCDLVKHHGGRQAGLSPLPPAFQSAGMVYRTGVDRAMRA